MFVFLVAIAMAAGVQIQESELPQAVRSAATALVPGATIDAAFKEQKDGKTVYELELTAGPRQIDLLLAADGALLEEEEVIPQNEVPQAIRDAASSRFSGWKIDKSERAVTPTETTYEIEMSQGQQHQVVVFKEDGTVKSVVPETTPTPR